MPVDRTGAEEGRNVWHTYGYLVQDIVRERQREAEAVTRARLAAELDAEEQRAHPSLGRDAGRPAGAARHAIARTLRGVSGMAGFLSRSACEAAARVDGRAL
jgi:negative regulator of sigma E activity